MREEALTELVKYAVAHGVKYLAVEDLERPRRVKGQSWKVGSQTIYSTLKSTCERDLT
jgi:hypothetical protein